MLLVFTLVGFRFFFYSYEGDPREPVHIHVRSCASVAKIWLYPEVHIATAYGFSGKELNKIWRIVDNRKPEIEEAWNDHFSS